MNYYDTSEGHIEYMLNKEDESIERYRELVHGIIRQRQLKPKSEFEQIEISLGVGEIHSLTEFEEAVSVETDTCSSEQAKTTKDKTTKNQSVLQHNKVNGFEKDIVNALSEESTL